LLVDLQSQSHESADVETLLKELAARLAAAKSEYLALALAISAKRRQSGTGLARKIERELMDLAMPDAKLEIRFSTEGDGQGFPLDGEMVRAFPHGLENVEFYISTNKNEPLRPMAKIASGGELSRIMLAILTVIAGQYDLPTIVFDEIDSGIGGKTAVSLADKLKALSRKYQIIAISHLPAIARRADHHLAVSKTRKDNRNIITIRMLKTDEVDGELARMTAIE